MHVVEIDQSLVRLSAPRKGHVRAEAFRIACPEARHFTALAVKIAAQFTRHIDGTCSAAVITDVHDVILNPHVMRSGFRHIILGDLPRIEYVGKVDDVDDPFGRNSRPVSEVEFCREDFISEENVVLIPEDRMGSGKPSGSIKLAVIETKLADKLRVPRTPAFDPLSDIEDDQSISPVAHVE